MHILNSLRFYAFFLGDFAGSDDSWEVLAQLRASPPRRLEPPALAVSRMGFSMIFCFELGFVPQQTLHILAPLWILNSGNASDKEGSAKKCRKDLNVSEISLNMQLQ